MGIPQKEEILKKGFIYFGYVSPELSSAEEYPDYIRENVAQAVEKIQSHQPRNSYTFAFMADLHYSTNFNHDIRTARLMNAYREIKRKTHADKLLLGGDFVNDGTKAYKVKNYRGLRNFVGDEKVFPVNGNHDDNSIWDVCVDGIPATQHLTAEELYTLFYNHLPDLGAKFNEKAPGLYYYFDDPVQKVRYIGLDTSDIPVKMDEQGSFVYTKQSVFALSQAQIDWLIGEALPVAEDWEIIFFAHNFPSEREDTKHIDFLPELLDAYQTGTDLCKEYDEGDFKVKIDAKFSQCSRGKIIAGFAGHHHADFEVRTQSGIPVIFTGNVMMYQYSVPRIDGVTSELLFDAVTIDRDAKIIHTVRVGAGEDRAISYK